jgi:hypothetical protein
VALILFSKSTPFMDKYHYEAGVTYEVPERLQVKFCSQMGVAVEVQEEDAVDVQPNPSAELYDGEELVVRDESAPAPTEPEAAPEGPVDRGGNPLDADESEEVDTQPDPLYELQGKGGPWFDVVNIKTKEKANKKPLRKSDAEKLLNELASNTGSAEE